MQKPTQFQKISSFFNLVGMLATIALVPSAHAVKECKIALNPQGQARQFEIIRSEISSALKVTQDFVTKLDGRLSPEQDRVRHAQDWRVLAKIGLKGDATNPITLGYQKERLVQNDLELGLKTLSVQLETLETLSRIQLSPLRRDFETYKELWFQLESHLGKVREVASSLNQPIDLGRYTRTNRAKYVEQLRSLANEGQQLHVRLLEFNEYLRTQESQEPETADIEATPPTKPAPALF